MKEQAPPTFFIEDQQTHKKIVNLQPFLYYLTGVKNPEFANKNLKNIEAHLTTITKTPNADEQVPQVATFLCRQFKTGKTNTILEMIKYLINVDLKYQAKTSNNSGDMIQENINLIDNNQIIALPYGPVLPSSPPIVLHAPDAMSDVYDQKKHGDSKIYYNEDNERVVDYLRQKFKIVKRQSISLLFSQTVELICTELFQQFLEQQFQKLSPAIMLELLKLIDYMNPPIYTFYLMHLTQNIKNKICHVLELKQTQKRINKDEIQGIIYALKNIADRWAQNQQSLVEEMQWSLQMRVINLFISSQISQKKLFAVKMLCEVCRRSLFSSSKQRQEILDDFIISKGLLNQIYRADNHPQIITKGEQVFLYLVKQDQLDDKYIDIIFNLLQKCHENVSKSLFTTLQRVGFKNIQKNRRKLLKKIQQLPRPSCFNEQTFVLIESIMISTPPEEVEACLETLYKIMQKNYDRLKENLKAKAVIIYFQVFIMGIDQNIFDHSNAMLTLKPILHNPNSSLFSFMIQNFIFRLKDQFSKQNGLKCKKTLNTAIHKLMVEEKIHKLQIKDQEKHLKILQLLLQNYQQLNQQLLSSQDLWSLIKMDRKFSKFLKYYPSDIQISLISHLITSQNKSSYDIECIIDLYQLMNPEVKNLLSPLIFQDFFNTHNLMSKYLLASHVLEIQQITIEQALQKLEEREQNIYTTLSWIVLIRQILNKVDEKGYGKYPPYEFIKNGYQITIKVTNNINLFIPVQTQLKVKSFMSIFQITRLAVNDPAIDFNKIKIKLNNEYVTLNQLKQKICNLTAHKFIILEIYETEECEWFNKDLLFNRQGFFKDYIIDIFKEVFRNYSENGRLRASQVSRIFQIATDTQIINENDHRIIHIFNNYSSNGQFLKEDEWINFYYQSSLKNAPLVVDNLKKLGYSHLLKTQSNFFSLFSDENSQRQYLSKDGKIYDLLFKTYQQLMSVSSAQLQQSITRQFTATLNLLPPSSHIVSHLKDNSADLFFYSKQNNLYYWYVSNLLESIYFNHINLEQHSQWKEAFQNLNHHRFLVIYEQYLFKIITNGPQKYRINIHLQFFILQNLGKVLRGKIRDIPSLNNPNIELTPLSLKEAQVVTTQSDILGYIRQLGEICTAICRSKRDNEIAQNILAIVLDKLRTSGPKTSVEVIQQLIFSQIATVRQIFNSFYYQLSTIHPQIKKQYYSIRITKDSKLSFKHCREYFIVLNKLLFNEQDDSYYKQISLLYQREISQQSYNINLSEDVETDQILLGKLKILNQIKLYNPDTQISNSTVSSIKNLLQNNLSEQVRDILYSMSNSICDIDYSLRLIIKIMKKTNLKRNSVHRGKKKMGIMNLGCICYINSVLQQLQMIEPFRRGIIATEVQEDPDFFTEFQHIIYQLTYGQRIFLIPQKFCLSYLDHNNMPINIKQQHDADQFLNQLFDRLQFRLKNTNQRELINSSFKGELVNIINCQKCYHKKQRQQNFYILSVQIKNQNTLKECLNKLIEPEIICDYFCDYCQGKVETIQKYNRFHSLPPFLFIHLQRLVFDLQTFTKIKLTHPIQFPTEINLTQFFSHETVPQIYVLKGFVVHVGTSEGGHYYSIIKCGNGWIKFDDTRIDDWDWNAEVQDRNNAYLLIYQKKQVKQIVSQQVKIGNMSIMRSVQEDIDHLMKEKIFLQPSFTHYLLDTLKKIHVPGQFLSNPNQSAYQFNFSEIPQGLQNELDLAFEAVSMYIKLHSEMKQMRITSSNETNNNDDIAIKQNGDLQNIVYYMIYILHLRPKLAFQCINQYLKEGSGNFFASIYTHKDRVNREAFKIILVKTVKIIIAGIPTGFLIPIPHNELINKILQKIMMGLNEVGKNTIKMNQYFMLLFELCRLDNRFIEWFQANKLGPRLIHFYMQKESNLEGLLPNYPYYMNTDRKVESIVVTLEVLSLLVAYQPDLSVQKEETNLERKAYLNIDFYRKILNDRYQNQKMTEIFNYAGKNQKFNDKLLTLVLQNLNRFSHEDKYIYIYVHIMYGLLTIKDDLSKKRMERLFGIPLLVPIGESDSDRYLASKPSDRLCKYWNPHFKAGDEIIFSFLELLYSNKNQHNYFTLLGIICLLKLMTTNSQVYAYVSELPRPSLQYKNYTDWINDFLFNFQRVSKTDNNIRMSSEEKQYLHQQIAKQMRELQIVQQKSNFIEPNNKDKQLYNSLIKNYSQWQQVQLQFFQNLFIFNSQNIQQINNISPNQIVTIQYRILYGGLPEQMEENPQIIQYRIQSKQRVKIYFNQSYNYTLIFEGGWFEFALPFTESLLASLKVELLEEITHKVKKQQKMKEQVFEMNDEYLPSKNHDGDFPSIDEFYGRQMTDVILNEMKTQEVQIQCPFCCFKASSFSRRCPNCNEQWGEMGL